MVTVYNRVETGSSIARKGYVRPRWDLMRLMVVVDRGLETEFAGACCSGVETKAVIVHTILH